MRLLCLLLGLSVMTGCADPAPAAEPPTGEWSTAGCAVRRPAAAAAAALSTAMTRIDEGGRGTFPDSYAGLEVDEPAARAIVYRVPSRAFDDFVRQAAQDACVVIRDAAHSHAALTALHQRIVADLGHWQARGIRISTVGARHDGNGVEVGTQDPVAAGAALPQHYPGEPVIIVAQAPVRPLRNAGPGRTPEAGG
jgi:hypothetical protein